MYTVGTDLDKAFGFDCIGVCHRRRTNVGKYNICTPTVKYISSAPEKEKYKRRGNLIYGHETLKLLNLN